MAADDFAIVVGIATYPDFGESPGDARNLLAPDDDAADVVAWLKDANGGAVPDDHVRVVRSSLVPPGTSGSPWPSKDGVLQEFDRLEQLSQVSSSAGSGARVGRRLYVYAGGHGFARKRKEGALFAADATRIRRHHVFTSAWLEWFANAGYFDEAVLWMDTCMWPDSTTILEPVGYRPLVARQTARMFSAYAARFPLQAVERRIDGGPVRAVFTHALLEGLRGGAADPMTHEVTSARLRDYLTNHMRDHLPTEDLENPLISKEPDFGFDDDIVFCTLPVLKATRVTLLGFPGASEGRSLSIVGGSPPAEVATATVQAQKASVTLAPGLYFLQMANPLFAKGFQVPGGDHATVDLTA
ncbi:MAG TPA: hypothetical protein VMF13_13100 [Luteitalea sp.]|nr:hypothetical protein [Luteitalea sp.]